MLAKEHCAEGVTIAYEVFAGRYEDEAPVAATLAAQQRRVGRVPGAAAILAPAGRIQGRRSGNARWKHLADWSRTIGGV